MSVEIEVLEDPVAVCATRVLEAVLAAGDIVLAGGSTPRATYALLAERAAAEGVDIADATLWFGDERCVQPEDERSNFGMVAATLLEPLDPESAPSVHRMKGELGPDAAAEDYERSLSAAGAERFDLVLLGLGPDGHTASLFPGAPALAERERNVVGVPRAGLEPFVSRVSMTIPALQRARQIVFLVTGEAKAPALAAAFGPDARPDPRVPASLVAPGAERVMVLADRSAAARL